MLGTETAAEHGADGYICPVCHRHDHAEKASSLVRRNSGTVVVGGAPYPYFSTLAGMLAIPPRPQGVSPWRSMTWALVSLVMAALGGLVILLLRDQNVVDIPRDYLDAGRTVVVGFFAVAIPVFLFLRWLGTTYLAYSRLPGWTARQAQWSHLYYCSADDVVFLRGDSRSVAPEAMAELLDLAQPGLAAVPVASRSDPAEASAVLA